MLRRLSPLLIVACLLGLILACYGPALFRGRQFSFRDAAHYYYPLYQRVHEEWNDGRWPLWEPEENSGMPLLGNPTAAVLYPGQLIYRALPYAWGARIYTVAHTLLAFAGMYRLMRGWETSRTGSGLAALSYAFGAPILFQYCNIIYLVGAAWTPWGMGAIDRWARLGRRRSCLGLGVVLAMQTLGGDPESSYILGFCAGGYALGLARLRGRLKPVPMRWWPIALLTVAVAIAWIVATLACAAWLPRFRVRLGPERPPLAFAWMAWARLGIVLAWGVGGAVLLRRDWRRGRPAGLTTMLGGLAGAAVLAVALASAQLLPVLEFTGQSGRAAGEGPHDIYPFSLEPVRLAELVWPNVFGTSFAGNRSWLALVPPSRSHDKIWAPSLYLGGLTLLLALGAFGFRDGPPWRGWLTAIAVVSLFASLGTYTSPIWWARFDPEFARSIGPHDPKNVTSIRLDGFLRDGDGGFYWFLSTVVPGFRQFRFPSKLLSFTALALAGLSGLGWDRLTRGEGRARRLRLATILLLVSGAAFLAATVYRGWFVAVLGAQPAARSGSLFGPLDVEGAFGETRFALGQAVVVFAFGLFLTLRGARRPGWAGAVALVVLTADLGLANSRYVLTLPQALMERTPKAVRLLEAAEREKPSDGPFRIHRMPIWNPMFWSARASPDRVRDFVQWERDSIQPKYGISPYHYQYTMTLGVAELYDYEWFFGGFLRTIDEPTARALDATPGQQIVVFPRRSFDIWNTRYFIVPVHANGWKDEDRGFASFLPDVEPVYPGPGAFEGPEGEARRKAWAEEEDFQIFRNKRVFPRAWVVHRGRFLPRIRGMGREERDKPMTEILYADDPFWHDPTRHAFDPRVTVWIGEEDKTRALIDHLPGQEPISSETATILRYGPQRVEIDAVLERPGMVVLADIYYPGWRLTIDGAEAPIYRANRMMRGAAVASGRHKLIYNYEPESFRLGGRITLAGLAALLVLGAAFAFRPISPTLSRFDTGPQEGTKSL